MSKIISLCDLDRKNFKAEEFFVSNKAQILGIVNYPNQAEEQYILSNLMIVADKAQEIRDIMQKPFTITSGYRCLKLNRAVGSKDNSQHLKGQAIDFQIPFFGTPEKIVIHLKEKNIIVDQCLIEDSWVHLSIKDSNNRKQFGYYLKKNNSTKRELVLL